MKLFILTAGILFLFSLTLSAQDRVEDVVYLKNGSIIRGEITEMKENDFLKIETVGRNLFVISMDEVEDIRLESVEGQLYFKEKGYMNRSGIEILNANSGSSPRFYMVNGYQFNSRFGAGFGIGFTPYNDPLTLIPFFIDMNLRFLDANSSPYIFIKTGYNFAIHHDKDVEMNDHKGGMLFNPGFGLQFNLSSGLGWFINVGYNIDNSSYEFDTWGPQTVETNLSYRRVNFGLGLSF
jgi:opacity protein-like surface antigen